jgi:hypothetical protein
VVIDLAVEDEGIAAVLGGHGLMPAGQVEDRETAEAEAQRAVEVLSLVVGAAMEEARAHAAHVLQGSPLAAEIIDAADAAHRDQDSILVLLHARHAASLLVSDDYAGAVYRIAYAR